MATSIHITVSDFLDEDIRGMMIKEGKTNRSEYLSDIIRLGLQERKLQLVERKEG